MYKYIVSRLSSDARKKEKKAYRATAKFFIHAGVNPNTIKTSKFEEYMKEKNYSIFPRSVSKLEKEILKVHEECKEKAKKFLKDFEGKITLSYERFLLGSELTMIDTDFPILHEDFVCLTAHFIDDNWNIKKWILRYKTDQNVPLEDLYVYPFKDVVQNFKIESKISTLLLPIEQGFDEEMLDPFKKWIEDKGNNQINSHVLLIYCCADLFRLMVNDLFKEVGLSLLEDVCILLGWGKCRSTNWNIILSSLQRAVDMKSEDVFSKNKKHNQPSDEDWINIKTFCKLTGCIYKVTTKLFENEYPTSNVYFHLLAELKLMLNQELASADSDYFLCKANKILSLFDKYWNKMFLVLATASVLDPRFKLKYLEFYCSNKEVNDEGFKAETVLDYLRNLCARCAVSQIYQKPICPVDRIDVEDEEEEDDSDEDEDDDDDDNDDDDDDDDNDDEKDKKEKNSDAYKDFVLFQEFLKFEKSPREELNESELESYLKESVMEWNKDFKALEWWKEESQKYPNLARVARDILSIPISRTTSCDAYVMGKREPLQFVLSIERPKVTNAMVCSKNWLLL